ncbi:MAG: hypothetical protein M3033_17315 [Acidobacteriota bacterium]|nr:hypothetical protein [Acidobacteriota bacterium]
MKKVLFLLVLSVFAFAAAVSAQPRPIEKKPEVQTQTKTVAAAPNSFPAKYDGGMYGFSEKKKGTLKFDDANERLVFYGEDQKEKFSIPYKAMLVISPQSRSVRSTTGTVVSAIPLPGAGLASLMRSKNRYLVVNYDDPDVDVKGLVNFKLANKELLESVIQTLGEKAKLKQRGDSYYRPRDAKTEI